MTKSLGNLKRTLTSYKELPEYIHGTNYGEVLLTKEPQWLQWEQYLKDTESPSVDYTAKNANPLPQAWSTREKSDFIEVMQSNLEASFFGPDSGSDHDAALTRSDCPVPNNCSVYYFEIQVLSCGKEGRICVGFCKKNTQTGRLPGTTPESWGYHGHNGEIYHGSKTGERYGPQFQTGDVVGCGLNLINKTIFFTKNGAYLGVAFTNVNDSLYPTVGLKSQGEHIRANFGQTSFLYEIDHAVQEEKELLLSKSLNIASADEQNERKSLLKDLVSSFLINQGYVETAQEFCPEKVKRSDVEIRKKINQLLCNGDLASAVQEITVQYPRAIQDCQDLSLSLRFLQFIQLMRNMQQVRSCSASFSGVISEQEEMKILEPVMNYSQQFFNDYEKAESQDLKTMIKLSMGLLAYYDPSSSPLSFFLENEFQKYIASRINGLLLKFSGSPPESKLQQFLQHTIAFNDLLCQQKSLQNTLINVQKDFILP
ncbi:ran GTPase binding protein [Schizosaccharomyces octosporus yFS286]|uniref:Ran GTPase binding protein n=1 Tax=Schizosaccharomyces octosporus (strain yFS286) TaxID=483514 RepID=S9PTV2_SCHOY|nr:ran GTPase binding protein [Schizosaccharomyces octosporus yFS286]EPX70923.1 ran GTPase binding protein [Schizosaccharomyces octosporus yFS286]